MIIACIITYNDIPLIKKSIESVYDTVDAIVCVDGRFKDFPGDTDISTDGTLQYLNSLNKVTLFLCPSLTQADKRTKYFIGTKGDWYLVIDSDEVLLGDLTLPDSDLGLVDCDEPYDKVIERVRLFKHIDGMHYAENHHTIRDSKGQLIATAQKGGKDYDIKKAEGFKITHLDRERSGWRLSERDTYYATRKEKETL